MSKAIILIGFMGAGKTTVGRELAKKLGVSLTDTDREIEKEAGISINEIFATKGEEEFRKLETGLLERLRFENYNGVIATGGGMPLREQNRKLLKKIGRVYYLKTDEEKIFARISENKDRPLINTDNPRERVHKLFVDRADIYEEAGDVIIDGGENPKAVAEAILADYKKWEKQK